MSESVCRWGCVSVYACASRLACSLAELMVGVGAGYVGCG